MIGEILSIETAEELVRLKKRVEELEQINEEHRKINGELRKENETLKRDKNMMFDANCNLSKVMNNYKARIDKAIEFLDNKEYYITIFYDNNEDDNKKDELLEILKRKSDE